MKWPTQSGCDAFYGDPRGKDGHASAAWEAKNLVRIIPPWQMTYMGKPMTKGFRIHRLCHDSLSRVFSQIADAANHMPNVLKQWGVDVFGGSYNYRLMRGSSSRISMHSYGCAIDLDPERNVMGTRAPDHFATIKPVLAAFQAEGWDWLGDNSVSDGMHWQAARA